VRRRRRRWVARTAAVAAVGLVAYLAVTSVQVWAAAHRHQDRRVEAIVVLGAAQYNGVPSPDLEARLSHALALWRAGLAPAIVVTGSKEPGDRYTEATAGATWLADHGVPQRAIIRVVQGRDTWQSLSAVAAVLEARHERRVLLVSDPFHDERIILMSDSVGLAPLVSPTATSPIRGTAVLPYYAKETLEVAVGRVIGFRRLSELTHG
jgi:uncharacterized SAM-binding protein YcdF (DUF218 family)